MFGLSPRGVAGCGVGEGGPCGAGAGGNGPTGIGRPWPPIVPAEQPSRSLLFVGPTFEYRLHEPPLPGECHTVGLLGFCDDLRPPAGPPAPSGGPFEHSGAPLTVGCVAACLAAAIRHLGEAEATPPKLRRTPARVLLAPSGVAWLPSSARALGARLNAALPMLPPCADDGASTGSGSTSSGASDGGGGGRSAAAERFDQRLATRAAASAVLRCRTKARLRQQNTNDCKHL